MHVVTIAIINNHLKSENSYNNGTNTVEIKIEVRN